MIICNITVIGDFINSHNLVSFIISHYDSHGSEGTGLSHPSPPRKEAHGRST